MVAVNRPVACDRVFNEYHISRQSGTAVQIIHCPWCGSRPPDSKRARWYCGLESLGLDPDERVTLTVGDTMTRLFGSGGPVTSRPSTTRSPAAVSSTGSDGREAPIDGGEAVPNVDGPSKTAANGYQHFWWKQEWIHAIPDTVLAHLDFRVKGQASCERKARWQGLSLIIITSLVPVAAAAQLARWSIALLGALASMIAAIGQLYGWKENAIREARSVMQIQRELVLWKNGMTPYRALKTQPTHLVSWEHDNVLLSIRAENVVQSEGKGWATWFEQAERSDDPANDVPRKPTPNNGVAS